MPTLNRRELLRWLGAAAALANLPACTKNGDGVFTSDELDMLRGFADVIIPPDDQPGGSALGVVAYIEALVAAFDASGAPRIYAGGPFSDRNPNLDGTMPANDFTSFVELDRVLDAAWRIQISGSAGLPDGAPNDALLGPVIALEAQLKHGLAAARATVKGTPNYQVLYDALPSDFQQLVFDLVTQAAWAAPEYGGNPNLAGWNMVHFEGDSLPFGYSRWNGVGYDERPYAPMSTANPSDPEPLTMEVEQLLSTVVAALGGRDNS